MIDRGIRMVGAAAITTLTTFLIMEA